MRILIIGGTRFIGPQVVRRLHAQGHEVTLFHRGKSKADLPAEIEWENGCMVAIAKNNPTPQYEPHPDQADGKDVQVKDAEQEKFAERDLKKLNAALLYYFLANASKSQINY